MKPVSSTRRALGVEMLRRRQHVAVTEQELRLLRSQKAELEKQITSLKGSEQSLRTQQISHAQTCQPSFYTDVLRSDRLLIEMSDRWYRAQYSAIRDQRIAYNSSLHDVEQKLRELHKVLRHQQQDVRVIERVLQRLEE